MPSCVFEDQISSCSPTSSVVNMTRVLTNISGPDRGDPSPASSPRNYPNATSTLRQAIVFNPKCNFAIVSKSPQACPKGRNYCKQSNRYSVSLASESTDRDVLRASNFEVSAGWEGSQVLLRGGLLMNLTFSCRSCLHSVVIRHAINHRHSLYKAYINLALDMKGQAF
jgi:hypothetical protein